MLLMMKHSVILPEKSTAILPDDNNFLAGHSTGMKLNDILRRVEKRLDAMGISADRASIKAGKPDAIRNLKRAINAGRKGVSTETITALAPALGTTAAWLISEEGPEVLGDVDLRSEDVAASLPDARSPTVKLKGYVGAGSEAHFYALADEDFEEVEAPRGSRDKTIALEIKGQSFGPLMDTWLVYYDDVRSPVTEDLLGRICVVGLADDRILVKKIVRNRTGGHDLISNSAEEPIRDALIEWAARVTDLKPRAH